MRAATCCSSPSWCWSCSRATCCNMSSASCSAARIAPQLSPSKTVEGFVGGVASATLVGAALWWITPFSPLQAGAHRPRHQCHGLLRRPRHVGHQARPRRQGLGPPDRGPRRHARGRLFGWISVATSFEPFAAYTVFKRGDVQEGGVLPIGPGRDVSPMWNAIFAGW